MTNADMYDFIINDEDEAMLLLYVREGEPQNASFKVDFKNSQGSLNRNPQDNFLLEEIPADIIDALSEADKLLVCEMSIEEDETKTQIVYAYEADIID